MNVEKLGRHTLIHGDASSNDVRQLLQSMPIQLVINDPPYGMNLNTKYSSMHFEKTDSAKKFLRTTGVTMPKDYNPVIGDDKPFKMSDFDYLNCPEQLWFGADYYRKALPEGGAFLVWDKRTTGGSVIEYLTVETNDSEQIQGVIEQMKKEKPGGKLFLLAITERSQWILDQFVAEEKLVKRTDNLYETR